MIQAPAKVNDRWKCPNCGRQEGDFRLLGNGLIQCMGCKNIYQVGNDGSLFPVKEGGK